MTREPGERPADGFKDPWGREKVAFEARTVVNRKDFGLNWKAALETGSSWSAIKRQSPCRSKPLDSLTLTIV